jgi:hypothetical protein
MITSIVEISSLKNSLSLLTIECRDRLLWLLSLTFFRNYTHTTLWQFKLGDVDILLILMWWICFCGEGIGMGCVFLPWHSAVVDAVFHQ